MPLTISTSSAIPFGRAKAGATTYYSAPGVDLVNSVGTLNLTNGAIRYMPIYVGIGRKAPLRVLDVQDIAIRARGAILHKIRRERPDSGPHGSRYVVKERH